MAKVNKLNKTENTSNIENPLADSPVFENIESELKENKGVYLGRKVIIKDAPKNLSAAIEVFGSIEKIIGSACQYIIAHSLLAKAREYAKENPDETADFEMPFEMPKGRAKSNVGVKLDANKLTDEALEAAKAGLDAAGIKYTVIARKAE